MVQLRFSILTLLILMGCANRGNPTGGEIDTEPPIVIKSSPENFTTNFEAEEIEIIFNESSDVALQHPCSLLDNWLDLIY